MPQETSPTTPEKLLIFGASARAAAFSALRAGMTPVCADLFADADLKREAQVTRAQNYPHDFIRLIDEFPQAPWIYTGALENYPRLLARLSRRRRLLGAGADAIATLRDPQVWGAILREHNLPSLDLRAATDPPPADGTWLRKPLRGAGGSGIAIWNATTEPWRSKKPFYFQKRAVGESYAALFLACGVEAIPIGVTRQLISCPEFHAAPFAYCGSIGPAPLPAGVIHQLDQTATLLAQRSQLRGLFGIDFIYDGDSAWPTEINPRYTASVEIFERCWNLPLLAWHCRACLDDGAPVEWRRQLGQAHFATATIHGKAIPYAAEPFMVPEGESAFPLTAHPWQAAVADLPAPGTRIETGQPICTLFAQGESVQACWEALTSARPPFRTVNIS